MKTLEHTAMLEKVNDEHILYLALVQIHLQKWSLFQSKGQTCTLPPRYYCCLCVLKHLILDFYLAQNYMW